MVNTFCRQRWFLLVPQVDMTPIRSTFQAGLEPGHSSPSGSTAGSEVSRSATGVLDRCVSSWFPGLPLD